MKKTTIKAIFASMILASFTATAQQGDGAKLSIAKQAWEKDGFFEGYSPEQEIIQKRTATSKHFLNANGSYTTQIGGKMHYQDAKGAWQDVNPAIQRLALNNGYAFANVTNDIKSYFPADAGSKPVKMHFNGTQNLQWFGNPTLAITANGKQLSSKKISKGEAVISDNKIRYNNAYPGISEEFEVIPAGLENNTIIHEMTSELRSLPSSAMLEFSQIITVENGWSIMANGKMQTNAFSAKSFHINIPGFEEGISFSPIVIFDNKLTKQQALTLAYSPFDKLSSAEQEQMRNHVMVVDYSAEFTADGLKITTKLPAKWLQSTSRAFPVTIDPTATVGSIADGTFYGPMTHWYGFQRHATLYLQSEIGGFGTITAIEYYKTNTASARTKPTKVYMRTKAESVLSGTAAWNSPTYIGGIAPVYDGMTTQDGTSGWKMITLTTPFDYVADNLLIMVTDIYGGSGSSQYLAQQTVPNRQAYNRADGSDPGDASATAVENRMQTIRITYTEDPNACPSATGASATVTSGTTATINWSGNASNFEILVQPAGTGAPAEADGTGVDVVGATTYNVTDLTSQTAYEFYIRSECGDGVDFSGWSGPYLFNTTMLPDCPTDPVPAQNGVEIPTGNVTFSWTAATTGDPAVSYNLYYGLTPGNANLLVGNYTTTSAAITLTGYDTTFYWRIEPINAGGSNGTCSEWNFTTVSPPPAPANDDCTGAITLEVGGTFATNPIVGTNISSTGTTGVPAPGCASYVGGDVWYSVVVPASGNITIEANRNTNGLITDMGMAVYAGECTALTLVECDDDDSSDGNFPMISLTGRTPGEVLSVRLWEYSNDTFGTFLVSAYDASLSTASFDNAVLTFYPNPVNDKLHVSYSEIIDKVVVYNLLGQQVAFKTLNATSGDIDFSRMASGAYMVKMTSGSQTKTIKVLKN